MNVLGLDFSSFAVDLVLLDENADRAVWRRVTLPGKTAFDRTRELHDRMPPPSWYIDNDVYLVGLEKPFFRNGQDMVRLVEGAILACLPRSLAVWEVSPSQWKPRLHLPIREKPAAGAFVGMEFASAGDAKWPQDAYDALGVAVYCRDLNAEIVAGALAS